MLYMSCCSLFAVRGQGSQKSRGFVDRRSGLDDYFFWRSQERVPRHLRGFWVRAPCAPLDDYIFWPVASYTQHSAGNNIAEQPKNVQNDGKNGMFWAIPRGTLGILEPLWFLFDMSFSL